MAKYQQLPVLGRVRPSVFLSPSVFAVPQALNHAGRKAVLLYNAVTFTGAFVRSSYSLIVRFS